MMSARPAFQATACTDKLESPVAAKLKGWFDDLHLGILITVTPHTGEARTMNPRARAEFPLCSLENLNVGR